MVCTPLWAATISVKADRDPVALNESFRIIFTAEGSLDGEPDFGPLNKDLQLLGTGQSSQFSMVNGKVSSSKTYTLTVAPLRQGKITIPPISFGRDKSPPLSVTIVAAGSNRSQSAPAAPAANKNLMFITSEIDTAAPYVQQQIILKVSVFRRKQWAEASLSEPGFDGVEMRIQPLGKETTYDTTIKGKAYQVTELRYALFPQQSGELNIAPFTVTAKFPAGVKKQRSRSPFGGFSNDPFFDDFFSRQTYAKKTAVSKPIQLQIKPIPKSFTGKHWLPAKDIQLQETWSGDVSQLKVGEPVTRTLAIIGDGVGTGLLPDITMAETDQLKNYPDQPVTDEQPSSKGLLSTRTQKFAVIPSQPGQHNIPAIEIPWWNTSLDKIQIARIPAGHITASGAALAAARPVEPPTPAVSEPEEETSIDSPLVDTIPAGEAGIYKLLLAIIGVLTMLWLVTLYALIRNKRSPATSPKAKSVNGKASQKAALKQLQIACQKKQPTAVRDALIQWAKTHWPHNPPNNLEDIAMQLPIDAARDINRLSSNLYGQDKDDWDAQAIWQAIKGLSATSNGTRNTNDDALEPLYR
jgi:hypothetical protein